MHDAAGNQRFVSHSLAEIKDHLQNPSPELSDAIATGLASTDPDAIEKMRVEMLNHLTDLSSKSDSENDRKDKHYVSRFDGVGLFQSALSKVFVAMPDLQGYGDWNPLWIITEIEVFAYKVKSFFSRVHTDETGKKQSVWAATLSELIRLKSVDDRAPYPTGTPDIHPIPDQCTIALLADWGGDNVAAKRIGDIARQQRPNIAIHLGDIYYGGTKGECQHFLNLWPLRQDWDDPNSPIRSEGSWALNGNHEMFSGGLYFFNTVLPAFDQKQPYFCLENSAWRIIGLDTAYAQGRLKPASATDPIAPQWNWLVNLLKSKKKPTIFLTHHQPVSAHAEDFKDSAPLRQDIADLLAIEGIGSDAIYGWFFGHEHRCAIYDDTATQFNARLIGNGCIPHEVEKEAAADPGCTRVACINRKETAPGTDTAVSTFVKLTLQGPRILVEYIDEISVLWGHETWDATKDRLQCDPKDKFVEIDGVTK